MPYHYYFTLNVLLYCWITSIGLYFAGFLSVHASLGFALLVYIFMVRRGPLWGSGHGAWSVSAGAWVVKKRVAG